MALLVTEGYAAGTPTLRRAQLAFRGQDISAEKGLNWLWLAGRVAMAVWDDETWHILANRHVKLAREAGALSELPLAVRSRILLHTHAGELEQGAALIAEAQAVADATGSQLGPYGALGVAAWRGRQAEATELIQATMDGVTSRGEGRGVTLGTEARSRALLSDGERAENCYREAIERLGRTRMRPAVARAHLLYGEWLRRENRRRDAPAQLRTAHDMLSVMEAHIARLAVDGRTSMEIGAQLYLSLRTVEWHLGKVYTKLGIGSRRELRRALASLRQPDPQA